MSAHSAIGPSSAERWLACPGSVALSATVPAPKPSVYASEGSVAHEIAEQLVLGRVDEMSVIARIGDTVTQDGHEVEVTEEMVEGARLYLYTIEADVKALYAQGRPAAVMRHAEMRVKVSSVDRQLWGTADYLLYQKGNKLVVYDYKFGKGKIVTAQENPQAALYALGAMETVAGEVFDEVELVIVQPRAVGDKVKRWIAPLPWLKAFREKAKEAIEESREPGARIVAGDHCRWCPAQSVCPAIAERVAKEAQVDFTSLAPAKEEIGAEGPRGLPNVASLPVEKIAQALDWEDAIGAWYGAIRQRAQDLLTNGQEVPGYKLVNGRSNRKWVDDTGERAAAHFAPKFGHRVYQPKKPLSVAQMEKLVGKGGLPVELVVKPEAAKKVAKNEDPRPIASTTAQQDFDPLALPVAARIPEVDPLAAEPEDPLMAEFSGKGAVKEEPLWPA